MSILLFDIDSFRTQFPGQFPNPPNTDAYVEIFWNAAICYISPSTEGPLSADCRRQVLNLVTAHLLTLTASAQAGNQPGFKVSASIDGVSVTLLPPPTATAYQFFLSQSPYGIQAYAILSTAAAGGFYSSGGLVPPLGSYRRAGGVFTPPGVATGVPVPAVCPTLVAPPLAPYTLSYGTLGTPANLTQSVSILSGCLVFSADFSADSAVDVTLSLWSGGAVDSGDRFNIYYWDGTARDAGAVPVAVAKDVNPTGATIGSGFILSGLTSGPAVDNPNLVVITGLNNASTQVLNLDIATA